MNTVFGVYTTNMGSIKYPNKIGLRRGMLVVTECIEPSHGLSNGGGLWKCTCDCGNTRIIKSYDLSSKYHCAKSCGCDKRRAIACGSLKRRNPREAVLRSQYNCHKSSQRRHGGKLLTIEEWKKIVLQPCYYCGKTDIRTRKWKNMGGKYLGLTQEQINEYSIRINGIDRIDANRGYEIDNIVPCCGMCNIMKNGYNVEDFLDKAKEVYENSHLENRPKRDRDYLSSSLSQRRPN